MKIKDKDFSEIFHEIKQIAVTGKKYMSLITVYTVMALLSTVIGLLTGLVTQSLIDFVTKSATSDNLLKFRNIASVIAAAVAFMVFNIVFSAINSRVSEKIRLKVNTEMTAEIYDKYVCSSWEYSSLFSSGDILNRFNSDISTIASSIIGIFPTLISKGFQFAASFFVIFYYDKIMALIALITIPLSLIASRFLVKRMHTYAKELKVINSKMMTFNNDSLMNMQYLKSFGVVTIFCTKLRQIQREYVAKSLEYNKFSIIVSSLMSFIVQGVSYACFGWGVYRLWEGAISFGTLVLFVQLYSMLSSSFSSVIGIIPTVINATAASARISEIRNLPEDEFDDDGAMKALLENTEDGISLKLSGVSFRYIGEEDDALTDIDFEAESGDFVALTGPSGEGKTTLLRLLLSLVKPSQGDRKIICKSNGEEIEVSPSTRCFFSYVPQKNTMFGDTLCANMRLVKPDATDDEIKSVLKTACAYDFIMKEKDGINCKIGDGGVGFSEGQMQRLSIARALLRNSPILLFDEATSALDVDTEHEVLKNISEYGKNKICIFTTHKTSVFDVCNKAYVITGTDCKKVM